MVGAELTLTTFEPSDFEVYHLDVFVDLCGANFCKNQTFPEITVFQEEIFFRKVATLGQGYWSFNHGKSYFLKCSLARRRL